jgi:HD-GYP domain-containing protein (c-di-GMP phosphodiesterase class II)
VPKSILNKPGRLKPDEWELMKRHSIYGAEMLLRWQLFSDCVIRSILVAFEHHLEIEQGGYPRLSDRRDLNLFSRIVAIADSYDALTTPRPHRNSCYTAQEALGIMLEGSGTIYDPVLLKVFINTIGVHPIGTVVQLETGEMCVVFRTNEQRGQVDKPFVKVFANADGDRIPERVVDLSQTNEKGEAIHRIARTVDPADYFETIDEYLDVL